MTAPAAIAAPLALHFVALYLRISVDKSGRRESVVSQEKWGRAYAARVWPGVPVRVFSDNDMGAANGGPRPDFSALRAAIAAGSVRHLWTVEQSRLTRGEVEWFELAAELDAAGITELHTDRDGIVRVQDDVAGIKAVMNAGEVRRMKRRQADRLEELAAQGVPAGAHVFGYRHDHRPDGVRTLRQEPREADAIRWAASAVLDGWSLSNIAAELTERGHRGVHGGAMRPTSVRSILTAPTIAGRRIHHGRNSRGNWESILDGETFDAVGRKLGGTRAVKRAGGGTYPVGPASVGMTTGRRYVLTGGLALCGVCDAPMVGTVKQMRRAGGRRVDLPYLVCHPSRGGRGCTGILLEATEADVADRLFAELESPAFRAALAADDHAERRARLTEALEALEHRREDLAALWAIPGELTMAEWTAARRGLGEQESALLAELADVPPPGVGDRVDGAREAWPEMTLDEKRTFLRLFVERVTIARAVPGTKAYDPGRVKVELRDV